MLISVILLYTISQISDLDNMISFIVSNTFRHVYVSKAVTKEDIMIWSLASQRHKHLFGRNIIQLSDLSELSDLDMNIFPLWAEITRVMTQSVADK